VTSISFLKPASVSRWEGLGNSVTERDPTTDGPPFNSTIITVEQIPALNAEEPSFHT